jgi:hypothetical protein
MFQIESLFAYLAVHLPTKVLMEVPCMREL